MHDQYYNYSLNSSPWVQIKTKYKNLCGFLVLLLFHILNSFNLHVTHMCVKSRVFHLPIPRLIYGNANIIVGPHLGNSQYYIIELKNFSVKFSTNFLYLAYLLIIAKKIYKCKKKCIDNDWIRKIQIMICRSHFTNNYIYHLQPLSPPVPPGSLFSPTMGTQNYHIICLWWKMGP